MKDRFPTYQGNLCFALGWNDRTTSDGCEQERLLWCPGDGIVHARAEDFQSAAVEFTLASAHEMDQVDLLLNGREVTSFALQNEAGEFGPVNVVLKSGTNVFLFHSRKGSVPTENVSSPQSFMIQRISINFRGNYRVFRGKLAVKRLARTLSRSGLFFHNYYLSQVPKLNHTKQSAAEHYWLYGAWNNKNPNPLFDSTWYLSRYRDVHIAAENPLYHFIKYGWKEGRDPHPDFSTHRYLEDNPDVRNRGINPLAHYLLHGILEGRKIYPST